MNRQIETILQNQQMHAQIKHTSPSGLSQICPDADAQSAPLLAKYIVLTIEKAARRNKWRRYFKISCSVLLLLCVSFFAFIMCFPSETVDFSRPAFPGEETDAPTDKYPHGTAYSLDSPSGQAELAIEARNFEEAKQILDNAMADEPNFWLNIPYAELYAAMGDSDKAVSLLVDTIYNRFGVQNTITRRNLLYETLKAIPEESLTATAERRQRCLADCDKYIEKHETVNLLIEQELFYQALMLCEDLKAEGTYDNYLCYEFCQCYVGLKAYDECEAYLRSLHGKQTDILDHRYPDDSTIESLLERLENL